MAELVGGKFSGAALSSQHWDVFCEELSNDFRKTNIVTENRLYVFARLVLCAEFGRQRLCSHGRNWTSWICSFFPSVSRFSPIQNFAGGFSLLSCWLMDQRRIAQVRAQLMCGYPRAFLFDSRSISLPAASYGGQATSKVRRKKLMDPCQHVKKKFVASPTSENPKTRRTTGHATQQHVLLQRLEICQLVNTMNSSILDTAIVRFTAAQHFACSSDSSAALACHINITRSTDYEAVELPIIGFSIVIYTTTTQRSVDLF